MLQHCPRCDDPLDSPVVYIPSRARLCVHCAYDAEIRGQAPSICRRGYLALV